MGDGGEREKTRNRHEYSFGERVEKTEFISEGEEREGGEKGEMRLLVGRKKKRKWSGGRCQRGKR